VSGRSIDEPLETVTLPTTDLDHLLAVATLYLESFGPEEKFSLVGLMSLQEIEAVVERYGRRY
jgi:hypothetical protein